MAIRIFGIALVDYGIFPDKNFRKWHYRPNLPTLPDIITIVLTHLLII